MEKLAVDHLANMIFLQVLTKHRSFKEVTIIFHHQLRIIPAISYDCTRAENMNITCINIVVSNNIP